jgi:hypothetical protein
MTKYNVKVMLRYDTELVVEANDVYEANELAKDIVGNNYTVFNTETEEWDSFSFITPYDPEEV